MLLAARLKYQEAEHREHLARLAWHEAAKRRVETGLEMCRTAAKLGVEDEYVAEYMLQVARAHQYAELRKIVDSMSVRQSEDKATEAARESAEKDWAELLKQYHQGESGD